MTVRYGNRGRRVVVHRPVAPGEWLCLIGPNGAGKSSMLRAVAGLVTHDGDIAVDGCTAALSPHPPARRARRLRAAGAGAAGDMTGFEYVLLGRNPYIGYFGQESRSDRELVADVLASAGPRRASPAARSAR